jgi:hypothetical protein
VIVSLMSALFLLLWVPSRVDDATVPLS